MKVNLEYDTVEKTLAIVKDGKKVKDVTDASFYKYDDGKFSMSIYTADTSDYEENGMVTRTSIHASSNEEVTEKVERPLPQKSQSEVVQDNLGAILSSRF